MSKQSKSPQGGPPGGQKVNAALLSESTLFRDLPVGLVLIDINGIISGFNQKAQDFFGGLLAAGLRYVDAWKSFKLYLPDQSPFTLNDFNPFDFLSQGIPSREQALLVERPGLSGILIREQLTPQYSDDGNLTGMVSCFFELANDVQLNPQGKSSGLHQHLHDKNEELKRSEDQFHKMVEEVEDYAIVLLSKDGIIQNWNKGAEKIKGYKEHEIIGKSFANFYLKADREKGLPDRLISEARENGKAVHEGWRLRKDGTKFWGSIVITALHDGDKTTGFLKVTRDLTERKLAEDQAKEYTQQLEFQNSELQQFAFAASHDMKEPLRKINFYNSYVVMNGSNALDEKSREYLTRSMAAVKRMSDLIDNLLSYSQINAATESMQDTDLNQVLEEVINSHKDLSEQNQVRFETSSLPRMHVVPFQMRQLFDNLINNSIKYKHPERQSLIRVKCQRVKGAEINSEPVDAGIDFYKLSIIDNGQGFHSNYAEKIFEIFQRLNSHAAYRGSGIGLAICKKIVQNHHGYIKATGKENKGARFDVYLPVTLQGRREW